MTDSELLISVNRTKKGYVLNVRHKRIKDVNEYFCLIGCLKKLEWLLFSGLKEEEEKVKT